MKKIYIYNSKSKVILSDSKKEEVIFDLDEYKDALKNIPSEKYPFFNKIYNEYKVTKLEDIEKNFFYLFNFILMNNISNYIIDKYLLESFDEIVFDEKIKSSKKQMVKFSGRLDIDDSLGNIIICLVNSDVYLNGDIKIDYGKIPTEKFSTELESKGIEYFFNYTSKNIEEFENKLKTDLIAFRFTSEKNVNDEGRYVLPIYVDDDALAKMGIPNYKDYIVNWSSLAYLKMISKIHDFFVKTYDLDYEKGLKNDYLTSALIKLFDYETKPMPVGLEKSLEVGRSENGKCYFINKIETPIALPQEIAMTLQSKDAFSVVTKFFENRM